MYVAQTALWGWLLTQYVQIPPSSGFVVPDLDTAMAKLARIARYRWTQTLDSPFAVWTEGGERMTGFRMGLVDRTVFGDFDAFVQGMLDQSTA